SHPICHPTSRAESAPEIQFLIHGRTCLSSRGTGDRAGICMDRSPYLLRIHPVRFGAESGRSFPCEAREAALFGSRRLQRHLAGLSGEKDPPLVLKGRASIPWIQLPTKP